MPFDMTCTLVGTADERDEAIRFLEERGTLENALLIRDVCEAADDARGAWRVALCRRGQLTVGVASIPDCGDVVPDWPWDWAVRMDAVDCESAAALVRALPTRATLWAWLNRPFLQAYFGSVPRVARRMHSLYFTVSPEGFRPAPSSQVRHLTKADGNLFAGCERQPSDGFWSAGNDVWGVVRDGRVVTSAILRAVIPDAAGIEQRVTAICGLHTESTYRRQGLARCLVSHLTEMILRGGAAPVYSTDVENAASQGVVRGLGYQQYAEEMGYEWCRA